MGLCRASFLAVAVWVAGCVVSSTPASDVGVDAPTTEAGCVEGTSRCDGHTVATCTGGIFVPGEVCDPAAGQVCGVGRCVEPCAAARDSRSYIGCEYWSVVTPNPVIRGALAQPFAIVVSSVWDDEVTVRVEGPDPALSGASRVVTEVAVPPRGMLPIPLPADPFGGSVPGGEEALVGRVSSALVPGAAYRVTSSLPVVVYQFNPFEDSPDASPRDSADATLLLPASTLGTDYWGISSSSHASGALSFPGVPGFLVLVATEDDTVIDVLLSSHVEPPSPVVPVAGLEVTTAAAHPGETLQVHLRRGDVLKLFSETDFAADATCTTFDRSGGCTGGPAYDLTGSHITSSHPIAVIGGHVCTYVPYDRLYCDHLEEQLMPTPTWSRSSYALPSRSRAPGIPDVFRVVSAADANVVTFTPPSVHAPITLAAGEFFELQSEAPFLVSGTGRLAVAQYLVGDDYAGVGAPPAVGDPSLGVSVPIDQYRSRYDFLVPRSYPETYLTLVSTAGTEIRLDDALLTEPTTPIAGTDAVVMHAPVTGGPHHIEGGAPFGIIVYGFASTTSYLYSGGLNLDELVF